VSRIVIGLGNDLRGDDAAGLLAARALRALGPEGVDVEEHSGDVAALLQSISSHREVVVIDAVAVDTAPGTILELGPDTAGRNGASSHGLGLREALALAGVLGPVPTVRVIGIAGREFDLGAAPSPAVVRAAAEVAARLRESLRCA
jgi:hydrogenase maturation protease